MEQVSFFDTTLRDGEQSPGASMSIKQKREIAEQLERLGVNVIEAGFPVSSPEQFEGVAAVAKDLKKTTVTALCRAVEKDIEIAAKSLESAVKPRIHTFIATSPIHMKHKLRMKPEDVIEHASKAVRYARKLCAEVEFSAEDATRSDIDFMCTIIEQVIKDGATIINLPDTVGYSTPTEIHALFTAVRNKVPNIDKAILSTHCHDDLGLGVANTLSAINAGARQAELTINGIGERAGNAALEEVAMALSVRKDQYQLETTINTKEIFRSSRLVSGIIGFHIARNKAVVGENAFSHEAGIHQHGVLANRETYEIMTPDSVGREKSNIILGRHSGMHGFRKRVSELGMTLDDSQMKVAYNRFLAIADRKREVYDEDLLAIVDESAHSKLQYYKLEKLQVVSGNNGMATASVKITTREQEFLAAEIGDGPVDAIFMAIDKAIGITPRVIDFVVHALTPGRQAMGEVTVTIEYENKRVSGHGSSTDILEAGAKAYLSAHQRFITLKESTK